MTWREKCNSLSRVLAEALHQNLAIFDLTPQSTLDTNALDHVTRRFNASLAGLKKARGADLRWGRRYTRSPDPLEPRVSQNEARYSKRLVRMVSDSARAWIAVNAVQRSNLD